MIPFLIACGVLVVALVSLIAVFIYKTPQEEYTNLPLAGPSKCFSCEQQFPPNLRWQGRQTKCFDCERQLASSDPALANYTHGTKCFSCERELAGALPALQPPPPPMPFGAQNTCMGAGSGQCLTNM